MAGVQAVLEDAAGVGEESRWVTPEVKDLVQGCDCWLLPGVGWKTRRVWRARSLPELCWSEAGLVLRF